MREIAYFLVVLERNTPAAVAREVRQIDGVLDAYITMGEFDIIAVAEMEGTKGFPVVAGQIRKIEGVSKVSTCVVVRP